MQLISNKKVEAFFALMWQMNVPPHTKASGWINCAACVV